MVLLTRLVLQHQTHLAHHQHQVRHCRRHLILPLAELLLKWPQQELALYGLLARRQLAIGCLLNTEVDYS
jgi:hypothetical protein